MGPKRDELKVEWRSLHNEELHDLYSPNIIRLTKTRRARLVVCWREWGGAGRFLVGKPEYKRPSGMTRLGWEYNIKMDLKDVGL